MVVFAVFAPFAHVSEMGGSGLGYLALMGVVQMGLALFFLSMGARLIPAVEVTLIAQLENVLSPLWVWLVGIERPSAPTIVGGIIVIIVIIVISAVVLQVTQGSGSPDGLQRAPDDLLGDLVGPGAGTEPAKPSYDGPGRA